MVDIGTFDINLLVDQSGHVSLAADWCCPESTAFEEDLVGKRCWAFPPRKLLCGFIQHINSLMKIKKVEVALLVPVDSGAPWYKKRVLSGWRRRQQWPAGSDFPQSDQWMVCGQKHNQLIYHLQL